MKKKPPEKGRAPVKNGRFLQQAFMLKEGMEIIQAGMQDIIQKLKGILMKTENMCHHLQGSRIKINRNLKQ